MAAKEAAEQQAAEAGGIAVNELLSAIAGAMKTGVAEGVRQVNPNRSNPNYIPTSHRRPAGSPVKELTRRVIFKGIIQEASQLTLDEIDLFNQIVPGEWTITMMGLPRTVKVTQRNDGSMPDLMIDFPLSIEERAYTPPLPKILRAIIAGVSEIE